MATSGILDLMEQKKQRDGGMPMEHPTCCGHPCLTCLLLDTYYLLFLRHHLSRISSEEMAPGVLMARAGLTVSIDCLTAYLLVCLLACKERTGLLHTSAKVRYLAYIVASYLPTDSTSVMYLSSHDFSSHAGEV